MTGSDGRLEIAERALDRLVVEAGVLGIEEHEIAAGVLQHVADAGRDEFDDEMADLGGALARHFLQPGQGHGILPNVPVQPGARPIPFRSGFSVTDYTRSRRSIKARNVG